MRGRRRDPPSSSSLSKPPIIVANCSKPKPLCALLASPVFVSPKSLHILSLPTGFSESREREREICREENAPSDSPPLRRRPLPLNAAIHGGDGGGAERARGPAISRAADRPPAERDPRVPARRRWAIRGAPRGPVHREVRDGGAVRRDDHRNPNVRPDGRRLRRLGAGAVPLVPRQHDPRRRPQLRPHLLRRRRHLQAVLPLPLRDPARLRPDPLPSLPGEIRG